MKKTPIEKIKIELESLRHNYYEYDYSTYSGKHSKMKITCHCKDKNGVEHGEFWQRPYNHLKGQGCPKCAIEKNSDEQRFTKEDLKVRLHDISDGLYTLADNNANYKNSLQKIKFICSKHGEFYARASNLFKGEQCPYCRKENISKKMSMGIEKFTERLKQVHSGFIEITEDSVYVNNATKIKMICHHKDKNGNDHGEFWQMPSSSLKGNGCPKCKKDKLSKIHLLDKKEVEKRFKSINGNLYDYDFSTYKDTRTKMRMLCHKHGEFWQTPHSHIRGQGCVYCQESKLERQVQTILECKSIKFERQKTFEWLRHKKHLFLDFYLPDYKIAIECQGEQHFNEVKHFGKENFEICKIRDKIKNDLCSKNNIKVIYYSNLKYNIFLDQKVKHNEKELIDSFENF